MALDPSILICGNDTTLLDTRRWVLETARFRVETKSALSSILAALEQKSPDLIVLCHTLTPDERSAILAAAAAIQPPVKTLSFNTTRQAVPGETIDSFAGAGGLIAAVKRLVE